MNSSQLKKLYALYDEIDYGDGSSAAILANRARGTEDVDHELYWEAYYKLREYAAGKGEFLDYSAYKDMVVGLPYALQFVKMKIDMQPMEQLKELANLFLDRGWSFDTLTRILEKFENLTDQQRGTRAYQINTMLTDVKSEQTAISILTEQGML